MVLEQRFSTIEPAEHRGKAVPRSRDRRSTLKLPMPYWIWNE
jgi:hypothetical protein